MKTMKIILGRAVMLFVIFTILCAFGYTGVVTGLAQLLFPQQANGSMIVIDGKNTAVRCWDSSSVTMPICGGGLCKLTL